MNNDNATCSECGGPAELEYNDDGKPIGVWEETDPRDKNNLIITTYSDEGKVISVSEKTITYSSK